ncbi:uncharacterized protein FIBRA_01684 [Fibroporia radiculosa]|uniref:F-box domain-containing protein n=1 Tax=Fibroporia radiculosa TaxID=599839 RepID=J4G145_9APHY|nr:uncharacterized protein FIBRA_01684 [Fibroporia radiculosa]CCL99663.1 predicted protein [Fibroporia radiculosa]
MAHNIASTWPWLPVELLETILLTAWTSPMTDDERATLFTSLCQVNHRFLSTFIPIALRDVHIPMPLSSEEYLRILRERATFERNDDYLMVDASATANQLCRSLTFSVRHNPKATQLLLGTPSILLYAADDPAASAISSTLYMVRMLDYLPRLRRVSIEYANWGFDDIGEQGRLLAFPDQVTHLDVRFTFTTRKYAELGAALRKDYYRRWHAATHLPGVRHLSVYGAPADFVSEMVWSCSNAETVHLDGLTPLDELIAFPATVRELGVHMGPTPLRRSDIEEWGLKTALEKGLFKRARTGVRIVVSSGSPEAVAWEDARRLCQRYNVELVHSLA